MPLPVPHDGFSRFPRMPSGSRSFAWRHISHPGRLGFGTLEYFSAFKTVIHFDACQVYAMPNAEQTLTRGDGFGTPPGHRNDVIFSHVYEFGAHVDFYAIERLRIRVGYTGMFLVDVSEAVDQINFDLHDNVGTRRDNGTIFYHGPTIQVQVLF